MIKDKELVKGQGRLFVVSGPSGVGKSTLVSEFLNLYKEAFNIERVVSYTTRLPRPQETEGLDYHFILKDDFLYKVDQGFFIEWTQWGDNFYGVSKNIVEKLDQGKNLILVIDRQGAKKVLTVIPEAVTVWLYVSDLKILKKRLEKRGSENEESLQKRLQIAALEIKEEESAQMYDYHVKSAVQKHSLGVLKSLFSQYISVEKEKIKKN